MIGTRRTRAFWIWRLVLPCWTCVLVSCAQQSADPRSARSADAADRSNLSLDPADREYLWDLEHQGNVLVRYGLSALGEALRREDRAALERLLTDGFTGVVLEQARETKIERTEFSVMRRQKGDRSERGLDRAAFVDWLLEQRRAHATSPNIRFEIKSLWPVRREKLDGPWEALLKMRIWGPAEDGGPAELVLVVRCGIQRPTRARLAEPHWLNWCEVEQVTASRAGRFLFRDVTLERGIDPGRFHDNWNEPAKPQHTGGVYACDYNRDGCVDLLITDIRPPGIVLFAGRPDGRFDDVTSQTGLADEWGYNGVYVRGNHCAFVDLDNDGWEDLIVVGGGLFRNVAGERFEPLGGRTNFDAMVYAPTAPQALPGAVLPADYDRDGWVDLYVVRDGRGRDDDVGWLEDQRSDDAGNQLLRNRGNWQFDDVTAISGTEGGGRSVATAVWFDADSDGWPDLYVIDEFGCGLLLANQRNGTFVGTEMVGANNVGDFGSMGLTCGDVDNDGHIDLYPANMYSKAGNRIFDNVPAGTYSADVMARFRRLVAGSQLYRNRGGLRFEPVGDEFQVRDIGWPWGPALADLDNDGWLDLYATAGYMSRDRNEPDG